MTFDDDFLQLVLNGRVKRVTCKQAGVSWPPPERISAGSIVMRQVRRSQLSDDERAVMTHVRRGAEYVVEGMTR